MKLKEFSLDVMAVFKEKPKNYEKKRQINNKKYLIYIEYRNNEPF